MDFTLDTEQAALRDAVREMAGRFTANDDIGAAAFDAEQWRALGEMGVLADSDIGPVEEMLIAEELGRARVRVPYAETVLVTALLREAGDDTFLDMIAAGTQVLIPALSEPGRAWGAAPTVTADGDALSGTVGPVPYADGATGLVVRSTAGVHRVEAPSISGTVATLDGSETVLLTADAAAIAAAVARGTVALCAEALGAMQAALEMTVDYLRTRKQFGVPLMTFQTLTQRAADLYVQVELARSAVQYAAMTLADDRAPDAERAAVASRTKVVVGKAGRLVGQEAIQMHGGIGMTAEYAVGHLTARLTAIEHTWGDTRHHLGVLADSLSVDEPVDVI